jgi:hypothetical protein
MTARIIRVLRNAFFSKGFELFGFPFARDYLRLAWRASRRWGYQGPGRLKILGFRVEYLNQSHAVFLFHEIFVNAEHATFQQLRVNVERNMLSEVTLINAAVGEKTGRLVLYSGGDVAA